MLHPYHETPFCLKGAIFAWFLFFSRKWFLCGGVFVIIAYKQGWKGVMVTKHLKTKLNIDKWLTYKNSTCLRVMPVDMTDKLTNSIIFITNVLFLPRYPILPQRRYFSMIPDIHVRMIKHAPAKLAYMQISEPEHACSPQEASARNSVITSIPGHLHQEASNGSSVL